MFSSEYFYSSSIQRLTMAMLTIKWECLFVKTWMQAQTLRFLCESRKGWKSSRGVRKIKANTGKLSHTSHTNTQDCSVCNEKSKQRSHHSSEHLLFLRIPDRKKLILVFLLSGLKTKCNMKRRNLKQGSKGWSNWVKIKSFDKLDVFHYKTLL